LKEGYRRKHFVTNGSKKTNGKEKKSRTKIEKTPVYANPFDNIFFWINLATTDFSFGLFGNDKSEKE
jgi:hypothetical protein